MSDDDAAIELPLTTELLADLQAGLLDADTAARVRDRLRTDPAAGRTLDALNRVRHDVATLGAGTSAHEEVPPAVVAGIGAALRRAGLPDRPAHAARPGARPARVVAAVAGLAAAATAVGLGTAALIAAPAPAPTSPTTAQHITVSRPPAMIPLSDAQILALLDAAPDYGPLVDPGRRATCLSGLGYPASAAVLGAQPIQITGHPGVLLVLAGDTPDTVRALAVAPSCNSANTGLLADRVVPRPR
ncbi:hypothetical protein A5707_03630 [Mycobacterium kyorinense]|uniref:Anti-sigma-M factor RsmA n=1 Tax=Mycobacterium kyorinense TaxID=487514 RepID=A0A1A2Z534_9MYCO|nr:hypothetical protein [Mycobacterium kyorinense]OBI44281.1 hypothetical protein A5707_03630 [Mycobacterium kyorinense]